MKLGTRKQGGFTLLEILIALVVVTIIVVVILPGLVTGPQRARNDTQRKNDLLNLKTKLEAYYYDNNSYPSAGNPPQPSCIPSAPSCLGTVLTTGPTAYMKLVPSDPQRGHNYTYAPTPAGCGPGACTGYTLTAILQNTHDSQAVNGVYTVASAN